jgi:hypothetical protein
MARAKKSPRICVAQKANGTEDTARKELNFAIVEES